MPAEYGQFCPVAKAMEVLDERWTLLVVRELLAGSSRFNEIRRGVPKMSTALLAKRLRSLERAGIVEPVVGEHGRRYALSESGRALAPVVDALARWGVRWIGELGEADYDPHLLMWDIRRTIRVANWPRERTTVAIILTDLSGPANRWWLVVDGEAVEACDFDPGYPVSVRLEVGLKPLTRIWRGELSWAAAARAGTVRVSGPRGRVDQLAGWIGQSTAAQAPAYSAAPA
jgi:DNA-binding HxlR family transcriptional regulator